VVGTGSYIQYDNQSNTISNSTFEDLVRGGVVMSYEKNSSVTNNTIRRVTNNSSTLVSAAGIASTAGTGDCPANSVGAESGDSRSGQACAAVTI